MPVCSCPHCGRTGLAFALADAETVLECRGCGGWFTPIGGAVNGPPGPPSADTDLISLICTRCQAEMIVPRRLSGQGRCGRCGNPIGPRAIPPKQAPAPSGGPYLGRAGLGGRLSAKHVLQAALTLLSPGETLLAIVRGRAAAPAARHADVQKQFGRPALQPPVANGTNHGGPFLSHFLVVTDHRVIFWARGIRKSSTQYYTYRAMTSVEHLCGGGAGGLVLTVRRKPRFFAGMHEDEAKLVAALIDTQVAAAQPPPEPVKRDPVSALEKLARLLEKGLISRQEFEAKKRKLLKKI